MIFHRFFEPSLAQASFLIGCEETGEAIVVDPSRDIEQYVKYADEKGLRIVAVTETHIHADFASGSRELAHRLHVPLYLSDEGPAEWKYAIRGEFQTREIKDGDKIRVGNLTLEVLATPGHTPEHVSFALEHDGRTDVLTGDFIFVGDVGRPDLLERAAGIAGTMEAGARSLFRSLQKFRSRFGDETVLWPGHGEGSSCGKALGSDPNSTIAKESKSNWAFLLSDEQAFVDEVLAGQPAPPRYYAVMKQLNKIGAFRPDGIPSPPLLEAIPSDAIAVDVRPCEVTSLGHSAKAYTIEITRAMPNWAGWLLPYDQPIVFYAQNQFEASAAMRLFSLVGMDNVIGWIPFNPEQCNDVVTSMIDRSANLSQSGDIQILDVRTPTERRLGAIGRAIHIPLQDLESRISELDREKPVWVHCQGGSRSAIAIGILQRNGFRNVTDMIDGYAGYAANVK